MQKANASSYKIIAIGASTGGPGVILELLKDLPEDNSGILIVQHLIKGFAVHLAGYLDSKCKIQVREAKDGQIVMRGTAYLAPSEKHLTLVKNGGRYLLKCMAGEKVNGFCPSIDKLFASAACAGNRGLGIILTGMGDDGARGLLKMKQAGAHTIAQEKESCAIYSMPCEAIKRGGADEVLPVCKIRERMKEFSE